MLIEILLLIGVGALAGLIAGLLGVGGGTIIVPALIFLFQFSNTNTDLMVQMSVATSMACIVITSISSTYAHHQRNGVMWNLVKSIGMGIPLGALFGVVLVNLISGFILKILIVIFMIYISINMLSSKIQVTKNMTLQNTNHFFPGSIIGFLSIPLGIGGGTFTVPYLKSLGHDIRKSIGTSAACGIVIAVTATILFSLPIELASLQLNENLIYWPGVFWISFSSIIFSRLGARLTYIIKEDLLKKIFGVFIFIVAIFLII
ncbi:MAG: sulfite exporter TauE/SafE family protein [SAR86 cluster bacterium]|uniref:Probable membrane transporter protein n=1 Tax=SAR86 cluster bacterium TaxID=2030880 RepID=A0A368BUN5_9GAMM|nr:MAG: sulfite exporter TauE/SafE family protein [SAR86 cluster bacterium]